MALGKELVTYEISGNLRLQHEGLAVVKAIPGDFGIKVIAAVGPGRIGKSSLLNQLSRKGI
jgi:tRNA U34 5-carboxymethylaminomethyl modifying GTPase MnmE/TrmE